MDTKAHIKNINTVLNICRRELQVLSLSFLTHNSTCTYVEWVQAPLILFLYLVYGIRVMLCYVEILCEVCTNAKSIGIN